MNHTAGARLLLIALASAVAVGGVLASCASAPSPGNRGGESAASAAARAESAAADALDGEGSSGSRLPNVPPGEDVPHWIETYPSDGSYYIGIGGFADSEDRAELLERGRLAALRALAGEISTEIRSELRAVTREDSDGRRSDSSTMIMNAMVEEELEGVEVVDSYYSESIGQWFYLRLSKEDYRRYQQEEIAELERRLGALLAPVAGSPDVTAAQELSTLYRALGIAIDSPYGGEARLSVDGVEGYAADALVTRIQTVLDGLVLRPRAARLAALPGTPVSVVVDAQSPGRRAGAGRVPLIIARDGGDPLSVTADESGTAGVDLSTSGTTPGVYPVTAAVDLDALASQGGAPALDAAVPEASVTLEIRALSVLMSVQTGDGGRLSGMEGYLREFVSQEIPVSFADGRAGSDASLTFTVQHQELPENDYGIVFVVANVVMDARRNGTNVVSYSSPDVKEGGLDAGQALSRAVDKLQEHLAGDAEFKAALRTFAEG
ncbi:MAG: hypothetical protein ACLFNX_07510 [Spirochaetaceae bacterium]